MTSERELYGCSPIDEQGYSPLSERYSDPRVQQDGIDPADIEDVRERTKYVIQQAIYDEQHVLAQSPPNAGKTTSVFDIAVQTDKPLTYLAKRIDLYEQAISLCESRNIEYELVPSPHRDCPAFDKDSSTCDPLAVKLYNLGISAAEIHTSPELPCSPDCGYMETWDGFDPEATDIVIGHYTHAYTQSVIEDRVVIVDEFPGNAFEREFTDHEQEITNFLQNADGLPFEDFFDPIEQRDRQFDQAHEWFLDNGVTADPETIKDLEDGERYHTLTPFLVYSMLMAVDHGNGFELPTLNFLDPDHENYPDDIDRNRAVAIDRERAELFVLTQPDLTDARAVVGLDGTPTPKLWELATGVDLDHEQVLPNADARNKYLREAFGITIKQANDNLKSYHYGNVTLNRDVGLLYGVEVVEKEFPSVITAENARKQYERSEATEHIDEMTNFANVLSSNDFSQKVVGVIQGCPHPGDHVLKRWGAYLGHTIEADGEGIDRTYGEFGDAVYEHFVHNQVLQAVLRFGRNTSVGDATVYVNTAALPDWVEVGEKVEPTLFNTENKRAVADFLRERGSKGATKREIADSVNITKRTVETYLSDWTDNAIVITDYGTGRDPNRYIWNG